MGDVLCCCCNAYRSAINYLTAHQAMTVIPYEEDSEILQGAHIPTDSLCQQDNQEPMSTLDLLKQVLGSSPSDEGFETCLTTSKMTIYHKFMPPLFKHSSFIVKFQAPNSVRLKQYFMGDQPSVNRIVESYQSNNNLIEINFKKILSLPSFSVLVSRTVALTDALLLVAFRTEPSLSSHSDVPLAGVSLDFQDNLCRLYVEAKLNAAMSCQMLKQSCVQQLKAYVQSLLTLS